MRLASRQTGEVESFARTPESKPHKCLRNPKSDKGLLAGPKIAAELGIKKLVIWGDSQLVVRQVNKDYQSPLMEAYIKK